MATAPAAKITVKDYKTEVHNDWCPGCGDFGLLSGIQMALAEMELPPHQVTVFSGIGCSGKTTHYLGSYGFHTLHGRVLTVATGGKLANREQTVVAVGGDGDGYGIGAGYFVNTGRRNLDLTYIVFNNGVYGLTKGQPSPTLKKGLQTKSMPEKAIQDGVNPIALALGAGYTFIARGYALDVRHLKELVKQAVRHHGTALLDVLQTCPTYNNIHTKEYWGPRVTKLEEDPEWDPVVRDPSDEDEVVAKKRQALELSYANTDRVPIGLFYRLETNTYEDELERLVPAFKDGGLSRQDHFNRDVEALFESMR